MVKPLLGVLDLDSAKKNRFNRSLNPAVWTVQHPVYNQWFFARPNGAELTQAG